MRSRAQSNVGSADYDAMVSYYWLMASFFRSGRRARAFNNVLAILVECDVKADCS